MTKDLNKKATVNRPDEINGTIAIDRHNAGYNFEEFFKNKLNCKSNIIINKIKIDITSHNFIKFGTADFEVSFIEDSDEKRKNIELNLNDFLIQFNQTNIIINC